MDATGHLISFIILTIIILCSIAFLAIKNGSVTSCKNYILECWRHFTKEEIPVTIIDEYFDNKFIDANRHQFRSLNTYNLWANLENTLEEASIQTINYWDHERGVVCKTFNVPVSKNTNEDNCEDEDEEVVSYTLIPSNNKQIRNDGYGEIRRSPDYFYAQYNKNERKKILNI